MHSKNYAWHEMRPVFIFTGIVCAAYVVADYLELFCKHQPNNAVVAESYVVPSKLEILLEYSDNDPKPRVLLQYEDKLCEFKLDARGNPGTECYNSKK